MVEVPFAVYVIWALVLAVVVLVILPLAVFLLYRALRIARSIERYFADAVEPGVGIANSTSHVKALEDTIQVAGTILSVAGSINNRAETIKTTLATRASQTIGNGHH